MRWSNIVLVLALAACDDSAETECHDDASTEVPDAQMPFDASSSVDSGEADASESDAEAEAGLDASDPDATSLLYPRPDYSEWTHVTYSEGGTKDLEDGRSYFVTCDGVLDETIRFIGGESIAVIGCEWDVSSSGEDNSRMMLRFYYQTGDVYVEGVYGHGSHLTEGIQMRAPEATFTIQNMRVDSLIGSRNGNHADVLQPWGGAEAIRVYNLTALDLHYQGVLFNDDEAGGTGPIDMQNVNLEMAQGPTRDNDLRSGGRYAIWTDPGRKTSTLTLFGDTVWVLPNEEFNGGNLARTVWPEVTESRGGRGEQTDELGTFVTWEGVASENMGRVRKGRPEADYVPASLWESGTYTP